MSKVVKFTEELRVMTMMIKNNAKIEGRGSGLVISKLTQEI